MNNQIFVPVTDDIIYDHPEKIEGPLIPYNIGMECQNWLTIELNPEEDKSVVVKQLTRSSRKRTSPDLRLAYSN